MILDLIFSFFVYPGLTFLVFLSLISQWYRRKIIAKLQRRVGPKFVGPRGILQPFADIFKLMNKEITMHKHMSVKTLLFIGFLGLFSLVAAILITPLSIIPLSSKYDVFVFLYISFYATLAIIILGYGSSSFYPNIGSSRYLVLILLSEPIFAISLISLTETLAPGSFSLGYALRRGSYILSENFNMFKLLAFVTACLSMSITLLVKLSFKPIDVPEAETEIAGGVTAELSGPLLSIYILLHEVESTIFLYILANFLIPLPPLDSMFSIVLSFIKYFLILGLITIMSFSFGRIRIDHALNLLSRIALPISIFSFILALLS